MDKLGRRRRLFNRTCEEVAAHVQQTCLAHMLSKKSVADHQQCMSDDSIYVVAQRTSRTGMKAGCSSWCVDCCAQLPCEENDGTLSDAFAFRSKGNTHAHTHTHTQVLPTMYERVQRKSLTSASISPSGSKCCLE
eukprot:491738-Amphidinium_carterae.1